MLILCNRAARFSFGEHSATFSKSSAHHLLDKFPRIMHTKYMQKKNALCKSLPHPKRYRVTVAIKNELWEKFKPVLKHKWEGSFTSWLEYAMECYSRESCKGCPYEPDDELEKAPDGIGKVQDKGTK